MRPIPYEKLFPDETIDELAVRMIKRITRERHLEGFTNKQIIRILTAVRNDMKSNRAMLSLDAPIAIFGDIHGQLTDLLRYFSIIGTPSEKKMLFLGDYVDRGSKGLEVIMLLLCYKLKYPTRIHLLRGNHECYKMNRLYGFYEELARKRSPKIWKQFQEVFNELPLCAEVGRKILCMHGGISDKVFSWDNLRIMKKPHNPKTCDDSIAADLMWADPTDKTNTYAVNLVRAISVVFGEKAVEQFTNTLDISLIVRAHEVAKDGFRFFFNQKLVTVFSAPYYCGSDLNCGAMMLISENYEISFVVQRPKPVSSMLTSEQYRQLERNYESYMANSPDPCRTKTKVAVL